jgi:hypothetical protein
MQGFRSYRLALFALICLCWGATSVQAAFDPAWMSDERTAVMQ